MERLDSRPAEELIELCFRSWEDCMIIGSYLEEATGLFELFDFETER